MSEYTPTTEDVRQTWAEEQDTTHGLGYDAHADEFDRWLAAHDAEVAARTLREAAEAYERGLHIDTIPKWLRDLAHDQAVDVTKVTPGNRPN